MWSYSWYIARGTYCVAADCYDVSSCAKDKKAKGWGGGEVRNSSTIENSLQVSSSSPVKITDKCIHHSQTAAAHFVTKNQYGK